MRALLQVIEGDLVAILEHQEEAKRLIDQIHSLLSSVSFNKHIIAFIVLFCLCYDFHYIYASNHYSSYNYY